MKQIQFSAGRDNEWPNLFRQACKSGSSVQRENQISVWLRRNVAWPISGWPGVALDNSLQNSRLRGWLPQPRMQRCNPSNKEIPARECWETKTHTKPECVHTERENHQDLCYTWLHTHRRNFGFVQLFVTWTDSTKSKQKSRRWWQDAVCRASRRCVGAPMERGVADARVAKSSA